MGLLSSPVEHEQVSIVAAVDARETVPQTENALPEVQNENGNSSIDMPFETVKEETVEAANIPECEAERDAAFDFGGFSDLGDCDIPPNAFSKPKKPFAKPVTASPVVDSVDEKSFFDDESFAEKTDIFEEIKPGKSEAEFDPFASDELPIALWQPRKPASIAKPVEKPAATSKPAMTESLSRSTVSTAKFEDINREKKAETAPVDESPKHSSGNKRRERGGQRPQETFGSEQTSRERNDRGRNDRKREGVDTFDKPRSQEEKKPRSHRDSTEKKTFDDFSFDDDLAVDDIGFGKGSFGHRGPKKGGDQNKSGFCGNLDNGFDDIADFSPKPGFVEQPPSKRRGQKPDKAPYSSDADEMLFEDFENTAKSKFRTGANDDTDGLDFEDNWFKKEDKPEENRERFPKRRDDRKDRKSRPDADVPRRDDRAAFSETEEAPIDRSRRKSRQQSGTRQETAPAPVSPQKIAVPNWDDAIGSIIERNMERRPAKNDRDRNKGNNRGGGRRR